MSVPISPPPPRSLWTTFLEFPVTRIVLFTVLFILWVIPPAVIFAVTGLMRAEDMDSVIYWGEYAQAFGALAALIMMAMFVERRPLASYGLGGRSAALKETLIGFLIGAGCMSAIFGILAAFGWCTIGQPLQGPAVEAILRRAIALCFVVALFEEVTFRGYFFQTLEARWGTGIALVASMVVFGLLHVGNPIAGATLGQKVLGGVCITIEAGILLAAAYLFTRRLWMPIGMHWAWNLFQGPVYGGHVSGIDFGGSVLQTKLHGPSWATGGVFGPEAGVPALVVGTLVGVMLLRMAIRNGQWKTGGTATESAQPVRPEFEEAWPPAPKSADQE